MWLAKYYNFWTLTYTQNVSSYWAVLWEMTPFSSVNSFWYFRGTWGPLSALWLVMAGSFKVILISQTTWCHLVTSQKNVILVLKDIWFEPASSGCSARTWLLLCADFLCAFVLKLVWNNIHTRVSASWKGLGSGHMVMPFMLMKVRQLWETCIWQAREHESNCLFACL